MFLRFVGHGIAPNRKHLHIITTAQRLAHRILGIAEQARTHVAIGRQAQPVAVRAKMIGHGANKADRSRRARKVPIARRARAGRGVVDVERLELAQSRRGGPGIDARPQLVTRHGVARVHNSGLSAGACGSTAQCELVCSSPMGMYSIKRRWMGRSSVSLCEGRHILVEPAHHNAVDLNGLKAPSQRRIDASHGLLEPTQARDLSKERRVERVERNVDAVKPGIFELRRQLGQQGAIGGERDVLDLRNRTDVTNKRDDTGGLTSGSPPVRRTRRMPSPATKRTKRAISSALSSSSCARGATPSAGMQ